MLDNFGAMNFALILFWLTLLSGVMYALDLMVFKKSVCYWRQKLWADLILQVQFPFEQRKEKHGSCSSPPKVARAASSSTVVVGIYR